MKFNLQNETWELNPSQMSDLLRRAQQNLHPLRDLKLEDVQQLIAQYPRIQGRDQWAEAWLKLARQYVNEVHFQKQQKNHSQQISEKMQLALRYYYLARWPIPNSPLKQQAYTELKQTFIEWNKGSSTNLVVLTIPYGQQNIRAYLRHPDGQSCLPTVIHWGGIDTWKEDLTHLANVYVSKGWASVVLDMPGTGECPEIATPSSESYFFAVLDYLAGRGEIDSNNIALQGSSWGGYWASKISFLASDKIKGAINWGGPIHYFFERKWQQKALTSSEYLFDIYESVCALYGVTDFEKYLTANEQMSLLKQDLLSLAAAKMLYINGAKDTLVPIKETELLQQTYGKVDIWTNPNGIHMGISRDVNHRAIMANIILPWLEQLFKE